MWALFPDLSAEAAYLRVDGQVFQPTDSAYVGLKARWTPWEWGAGWYADRAAVRQAEAAHLDEQAEQQRVSAEVERALVEARATGNAVEVARAAITSAEEAYRVTHALVQAGSATTTDLLDAQSALTGARLNLTRAEYEQAIARVALGRVIAQ
jgi:outer membrane protein TolC